MNTAPSFDHPARHVATRLTLAAGAGVLTLLLGLIISPWMAKQGWADPARAVADTVSLARDASVALVCLSLCAAYGALAVRLGRRRVMLALLSAVTAAVVYLGYVVMRVSYARVPQIWDVATAPDLYMTTRLQALRPDAPVALSGDHQQLQVAYPDLKMQRINADETIVYARLLHVARQGHMRVVSDYRPLGQLEVTQRSDWFGLPLDLVMRVQTDGPHTRVDYRCAPRYALGDPRACVRQIMTLQADVAAAVADYQALAERLASSRAIKRRDS